MPSVNGYWVSRVYKANGIYFIKFAGCSVRARGKERTVRSCVKYVHNTYITGARSWKVPESFRNPEPESHSKISYLVTTGLVCGYIRDMNRGSLKQEVSGVYTFLFKMQIN